MSLFIVPLYSQHGVSALYIAAQADNVEVCGVLLDGKADVNLAEMVIINQTISFIVNYKSTFIYYNNPTKRVNATKDKAYLAGFHIIYLLYIS